MGGFFLSKKLFECVVPDYASSESAITPIENHYPTQGSRRRGRFGNFRPAVMPIEGK